MVQLMPLPPIISCFIKIQNGLLFCCRLTQVVLEKSPYSVVVVVVVEFDLRKVLPGTALLSKIPATLSSL